MTSMKQIKKTIVGSFALASLAVCIFTTNASQQMPAPAPTTAQTQLKPIPDQAQQTGSSTAQPMLPGGTATQPAATAQQAPPTATTTNSTLQSMPPVTIDTMTAPQTGTPTQTMPQAAMVVPQPTVTTMPAEGQISAALAPGQSTTTPAAPLLAGQAMATAVPMSVASTPQATSTVGLSMTNPTQYPMTITLHIMPSNRVIQKDLPAGQSIDILSEPLSKTDTYTISGSLFQTVITKTTITTLSGPAQPQPAQFINTKTNRISSTKNWSAANPADQKIHLAVDFTEKPGAEPTFEIRQQ